MPAQTRQQEHYNNSRYKQGPALHTYTSKTASHAVARETLSRFHGYHHKEGQREVDTEKGREGSHSHINQSIAS